VRIKYSYIISPLNRQFIEVLTRIKEFEGDVIPKKT
jgi:hypothetical protein